VSVRVSAFQEYLLIAGGSFFILIPEKGRIRRRHSPEIADDSPHRINGAVMRPDPHLFLYLHRDIENWSSYLKNETNSDIIEDLITKTKLGRPSGEDGFIIRLEKKLGIELTKRKPGRPSKIKSP
jgi:hypothetical protein